MISLSAIMIIATYEAKLLWRSWSFRIFSIIGLITFVSTTIGIGATFSHSPHFLSALTSSLPLANVKMLNLYQGIIAVFMATEFFKRDRKHDSNQVIFTCSYSNTDYLLGKFCGILFVFTILNFIVMLSTLILHFTLSDSPFTVMPYIIYPIVIGLPTLVFMIGASVFLITLIRNQAVVFVLMLAYSLLVMIYIGRFSFSIFDSYALYQPILFSDVYGFANLADILLLRGAYLLTGLGLLFITVLFTRRLTQSKTSTSMMIVFSAISLSLAAYCFTTYTQKQYSIRDQRTAWRQMGTDLDYYQSISITSHDIDLDWHQSEIASTSKLIAENSGNSVADSILFTLNPGLSITSLSSPDRVEVDYKRDEFLVWVFPGTSLAPGESIQFDIKYAGVVNDRYCFLDIENSRYEDRLSAWLYRIPKKYALVMPNYIHLTPEAGWYPTPGLSSGVAFPKPTFQDFTNFTLKVNVPDDLVAISQGRQEKTADNTTVFTPENPALGISFTAGPYIKKTVTVDNVDYTVAYFEGHDYFSKYMDQLTDTIPNLIKETRDEFEVQLGLPYPYSRFTIVESPAEIYAYQRFWTTALDIVQPEVLYIPEMGMSGSGTDFAMMKRSSTRMQERNNQATSDVESQTWYFTNFVKMDILGTLRNRWDQREEDNIETRTSVVSNFTGLTTQINAENWPTINYAIQTALNDRVEAPVNKPWWDMGGLSDKERANLALLDVPLQQLLADTSLEISIRKNALKNKGSYLFMLLQAKSEGFEEQINTFLIDNRFKSVSEHELISFISNLGDINFSDVASTWAESTEMPGYVVDDVEAYKLVDGERTKTQMKMTISNPTSVDGLVTVNYRYQEQRGASRTPWFLRGQDGYHSSEIVFVPARSSRKMCTLLDQPPAELTIETFISLNIPGDITFKFRDLKLEKKVRPIELDSVFVFEDEAPPDSGEYLVDNEDAGFSIINTFEESYLRQRFTEWFDLNEMEDPYVRLRWWNPPSVWMPTTNESFYGRFVRSAFHKEATDGSGKVAWEADLDGTGDYDIYYHYEGDEILQRTSRRHRRHGGGPQHIDRGELQFVIQHEDGVENLEFDLNSAEAGWNYLGTYRLVDGLNRIEMTDENDKDLVIADAVKWVKR